MASPAKFDFKMLVTPAMIFIARKFDMKNEENVKLARMVFIAVTVVMLSLHALVYLQLGGNKKRNVKIWVPPKAAPVLPFGMGPPVEPVKPEDYVETTYAEHEFKILKESATGVLMSTGITLLMSFKFNVHVSLIIQSVSGPVGAVDSVILKKYILGISKDNMYGEFFEAPTKEAIAAVAASAAGEEPRVIELKDEDEKKEKKNTGSKCAEVPSKSTANDLD